MEKTHTRGRMKCS